MRALIVGACIVLAGIGGLYAVAARQAGPGVVLPAAAAPAEAEAGATPPATERGLDAPATLDRREAFLARVATADTWPLPAGNRIAGVAETRLAESPEAWLASLPLADQPVAAAFLERHAAAYRFRSREEQAWMIEAGYPALEEVVAMRRLPDDARACIQPGRHCATAKLAALIADEGVEALRALEADPRADEADKARARFAIAGGLRARPADPAGPRAPLLFALQVEALAAITLGQPEDAEVALALARVCGDYRMPDAPLAVQATVRMLAQGGSPAALCGAHLGFAP